MDFGRALENLKEGKQVSRDNWNGKGQWVTLLDLSSQNFSEYPVANCFGLKNMNGIIQAGWMPSMGDMLGEDWFIYSNVGKD